MEYIIFYDENYINETKKEIGDFVALSDGIGRICDADFSDKNYIMSKYVKVDENLASRLKHSIFVRHYYKIDKVLSTFDQLKISDLKIDKTKVCALHAVYGVGVENKTFDILKMLENEGYSCDIKAPEIVISATFLDKIYIGVSPRAELPTNYKQGMPHYAKRNEISRAEFKLQEATEYYNLNTAKVHTALDLGASPGGWTHLLAKKGIKVIAVDPAELDPRVSKNKNVIHYKELSQNFLTHYNEKFDMVVNDMKMFGDKSAHIVCNCEKIINTGATLVMTIKLAETKIWEQITATLDILKEKFNIIGVKKLFHNRQEVTVVAEFR